MFYCKLCKYKTKRKSNYEKHMLTKKHQDKIQIHHHTCEKINANANNNTNTNTNTNTNSNTKVIITSEIPISSIQLASLPLSASIYSCSTCNYITTKKYAYIRHIQTIKHKKLVQLINGTGTGKDNVVYENTLKQQHVSSSIQLASKQPTHQCSICMKKYKYKSGLSRHTKKCKQQNHNTNNHSKDKFNEKAKNKKKQLQEMVQNLNNEEFIVDLIKKHGIVNQTVNNYSNYYNEYNTIQNQFNLNIFLNEQCKNAMNIKDFIESINYNQLTWEDLLKLNGNTLYKNFSNMVIKQLNDIEMEKRPIHCTDKKRNTVYIKDNDIWECDKDGNKLTNVIYTIHRNQEKASRETIQHWRKEHPEWQNNDQLSNLLYKASSNLTECNNKVNTEKPKLVKRITENIIIQKNENMEENKNLNDKIKKDDLLE